jgi:selenocysteine lyase/cysteine desulfurase
MVPYINLDNAASTPALRDVAEAVERFLPYYSSVHRGTGFKSRLSSVAYDQAHEIIGRFVGAGPDTNTCIFGKNSTEALNKLAFRYPLEPDSIIISTQLEHHSNDLPWRARAEVVHIKATPAGEIRGTGRPGRRHRRLKRQRLHSAHSPPGAQSPRGWRQNFGRRSSIGATPAGQYEAG